LTEYGLVSQTWLIITGRQLTGSDGLGLLPCTVVSCPAEDLPHLCSFPAGYRTLVPGPCFPVGGAGHAVAGPPVVGPVGRAVLAVHRAVGAVVERLQAAHGAELVAGTPAGSGAVLPLLGHPEWMCTLLNIAHPSNRFWLLVDLAEAAVNHLIIAFPTASVFSVLETVVRNRLPSFVDSEISVKMLCTYVLVVMFGISQIMASIRGNL